MFMISGYGYSVKGEIDRERCHNIWKKYKKTRKDKSEKLLKYETMGNFGDYITIINFFEEMMGKELQRMIIISGQIRSPLSEYISKHEPVCEARDEFSYTVIIKVDDEVNLKKLMEELDVVGFRLEEKVIASTGTVIRLKFKIDRDAISNYDELPKMAEKKKKELEEIVEEANKKFKEFILSTYPR